MLTERLDGLDRVVRVALYLHRASSGPEPALEPYPAHGAGPELDTEAGHHRSRAIRVCALDVPRPPAILPPGCVGTVAKRAMTLPRNRMCCRVAVVGRNCPENRGRQAMGKRPLQKTHWRDAGNAPVECPPQRGGGVWQACSSRGAGLVAREVLRLGGSPLRRQRHFDSLRPELGYEPRFLHRFHVSLVGFDDPL